MKRHRHPGLWASGIGFQPVRPPRGPEADVRGTIKVINCGDALELKRQPLLKIVGLVFCFRVEFAK